MTTDRPCVRLGGQDIEIPPGDDPAKGLRPQVEPWLAAVLQSEHLSLLLGNGFSRAVAGAANVSAASMASEPLSGPNAARVEAAAEKTAKETGRGKPNIEDRIRVALALLAGLEILESTDATAWRSELDRVLHQLTLDILAAERGLRVALSAGDDVASRAHRLLVSFLLTFASRTASRDRLALFTTNYDRLVEWGCDLAGLRPIDRFVGGLEPVFRASRLDVDLHYNPPGIRGEPRYLEGVLRLTKIHGSLDWRYEQQQLTRVPLPFGAEEDHPGIPKSPTDALMIYPNPAKDVETGLYPYAELFRDLSAALCRPNSALVTYGYGFGDEHINRVLRDMLAIPSTHLVVLSYDWCDGRLQQFLDAVGRDAAVSLIVGPRLSSLDALVDHLLPKPAIDTISMRQADLLSRRHRPSDGNPPTAGDIPF